MESSEIGVEKIEEIREKYSGQSYSELPSIEVDSDKFIQQLDNEDTKLTKSNIRSSRPNIISASLDRTTEDDEGSSFLIKTPFILENIETSTIDLEENDVKEDEVDVGEVSEGTEEVLVIEGDLTIQIQSKFPKGLVKLEDLDVWVGETEEDDGSIDDTNAVLLEEKESNAIPNTGPFVTKEITVSWDLKFAGLGVIAFVEYWDIYSANYLFTTEDKDAEDWGYTEDDKDDFVPLEIHGSSFTAKSAITSEEFEAKNRPFRVDSITLPSKEE